MWVGHRHSQTFLMGKMGSFPKTIILKWILTPHKTVFGQERPDEGSNSSEESCHLNVGAGQIAAPLRMAKLMFADGQGEIAKGYLLGDDSRRSHRIA